MKLNIFSVFVFVIYFSVSYAQIDNMKNINEIEKREPRRFSARREWAVQPTPK